MWLHEPETHNTRNISTGRNNLFSSLTSGGWRPSQSHLQEASPPAQRAAASTSTAGREFPFYLHVWFPLSWFSFDPLRARKTHDDHQHDSHSSSTTQENLITTGLSTENRLYIVFIFILYFYHSMEYSFFFFAFILFKCFVFFLSFTQSVSCYNSPWWGISKVLFYLKRADSDDFFLLAIMWISLLSQKQSAMLWYCCRKPQVDSWTEQSVWTRYTLTLTVFDVTLRHWSSQSAAVVHTHRVLRHRKPPNIDAFVQQSCWVLVH